MDSSAATPNEFTAAAFLHTFGHAGHLDKVPMHVPVVVNRSEMAGACSGVQGTAYARDDIHHLLDRVPQPRVLRAQVSRVSGHTGIPGRIGHPGTTPEPASVSSQARRGGRRNFPAPCLSRQGTRAGREMEPCPPQCQAPIAPPFRS